MNILALDCATKTGWATMIDGTITTGIQDFSKRRGESNGMMFLRFNKWLKFDMCFSLFCHQQPELGKAHGMYGQYYKKLNSYDLVAYEQSHHRGGAATEIHVGMTTRVQEFAESIGAEYIGYHTGTVKKMSTGRGNASKNEVMAWYETVTGRPPVDDNEADARAVLECAIQEVVI